MTHDFAEIRLGLPGFVTRNSTDLQADLAVPGRAGASLACRPARSHSVQQVAGILVQPLPHL
jgi:hypothetical protein